jgi:putative ABC transport system substrate-binding protein
MAIVTTASAAPWSRAAPTKVCILLSSDAAPYRQAIEGFKEKTADRGYRFSEIVLAETQASDVIVRLRRLRPDLILALGTRAGKLASKYTEDAPVVFAMVANPVDSGILPRRPHRGQRVAGVTTDVTPAEQFRLLRRVVPRARRVAVIYSPAHTEATVAAGERAAEKMGMELVRLPVEAYRIDGALSELRRTRVDAIWTVTDPGVMVPACAKRILAHALEAKLPVIGFSPATVRAGALVGLGVDARSIGGQAGLVASAILYENKTPAQLHVVHPRETELAVNVAVAERIDVDLPDSLVRSAKKVFGR